MSIAVLSLNQPDNHVMPNFPLDRNLIQDQLSQTPIKKISIFPVLDSSNEWALQHADCGEVCLVEAQTAGRGRRGRQWHSPPQSNIYLSLKWCFESIPEQMGLLSLVVAVAVSECLRTLGIRGHGIKWPNDIVYQNRKLAGILIESKGSLNTVVIGIGLNVHMVQAQVDSQEIDQAWISIDEILQSTVTTMDEPVNRNLLVAQLLKQLLKQLSHFNHLDFKQFLSQWQSWDVLKQTTVEVLENCNPIQAQVMGITSQGALRLCLANGSEKIVHSADVSIRHHNP